MNILKYEIIDWELFKEKLYENYRIKFKNEDSFYNEDITFKKIDGDYLNMPPRMILDCLQSLKAFNGELYVITDSSYVKNSGPFLLNSNSLYDFAKEHLALFGDDFLGTDLIIVSFEEALAWLFHHEGVYTLIDLNSYK